jgi:tryptophan-rich sensory protein
MGWISHTFSQIYGLENKKTSVGLAVNIFLAVSLGIFIYALVWINGWYAPRSTIVRVDLPFSRQMSSFIWISIFALLGTCRWLIIRAGHEARHRLANLISFFLLLCALFPVYAMALDSTLNGIVGNVVMILFALYLVKTSYRHSVAVSVFFVFMSIWLSYTGLKTYEQHQINTNKSVISSVR